jgi:hypothetical protein
MSVASAFLAVLLALVFFALGRAKDPGPATDV